MDVTQQQWQPWQLLLLPSPLPLATPCLVLHLPHSTTTASETELGNSAGLKITFSFAELFLTQISSLIQVTI